MDILVNVPNGRNEIISALEWQTKTIDVCENLLKTND